VTRKLVSGYYADSKKGALYERLRTLEDQGFIGKRFDSSYKLRGRPAAYYLLPAGVRILAQHRNIKVTSTIYKNKTVSEQFITHCLEIFTIHNWLRSHYGDQLTLLTKNGMGVYDFLLRPLPDAFLAIGKQNAKRFFLDFLEDNKPFFQVTRRVRQYIAYEDSNQWAVTNADFPVVILVCESPRLEKRLTKYIKRQLYTNSSDVVFYLTNKASGYRFTPIRRDV
jgi:hypothetical protein